MHKANVAFLEKWSLFKRRTTISFGNHGHAGRFIRRSCDEYAFHTTVDKILQQVFAYLVSFLRNKNSVLHLTDNQAFEYFAENKKIQWRT